jgi:GR25 family glycosyltransferase involved in LPS biosynthesis
MSLRDHIGIGKLFEGAIIINLDSRTDRWRAVSRELQVAGISDVVERLPAIKHRYGMVGCSLSHLECVKIAKQRGWKTVLIFEDDIVFKPYFHEYCDRTLEQLQKHNWSVFHFGAMLMNLCKQVDNNLLRIGYNWAAHAVAVHERAYDFIINNYKWDYSETDTSKPWGGHYPFDGFINKEVYDAGFEIYSAYPVLISQKPDHSDTWGYHRDYKDLIEQSYRVQISNEVNVLIPSKNRPMQLHATLDSYFKYVRDNGTSVVTVLYTCDPHYEDAYKIVQEHFKNKVQFVREQSFFRDVKDIISRRIYTMFVVDDTIFNRPFYLSDGCEVLSTDFDVLSFSYRLGSNVRYSYINDYPFQTPEEYSKPAYPANIVKVNWTAQLPYIDFGYPFEISSSMYRTVDLLRLFELSPTGWDNPNYFELTGTTKVRENKDVFGSLIATYKKSVAVSIPLNRVQHLHLNRCGTDPLYVPESLLRHYEMGKVLNFDDINENWTSNSVHVELKPGFKPR